MGKISWGRVLLGGIVAGVVWWILEGIVHGMILGADWEAAMVALGRSIEQQRAGTGRFMMYVTVWSLLAGILGVWIYAAIRPRFGAGPKTAVIAGVTLWCGIYLMPSLVDWAMHLWPAKLVCIPFTTSFFEAILATLAGARLYKES
jgi:xanthosine utilization system XapX-like protein